MKEALAKLVRASLRDMAPLEISSVHVPAHAAPVRLDLNENPYPPPPEVMDALVDAIREQPLNRYPDPSSATLRALLAARLGVHAGQVVIGNGADENIDMICQAFAESRQPGEAARVLFPWPSFPGYRRAALASGCEMVTYPLDANFHLDFSGFANSVAATAPNIVFLARPATTGALWPLEQVEALAKQFPGTIIVSDEAYLPYAGAPQQSALSLLLANDNVIVIGSLSKLGLAALRLGFIVGDAALTRELNKVRRPFNVNALSQQLGKWLVEHDWDGLHARALQVAAERERLLEVLRTFDGLELFPSTGNFVLCRCLGVSGLAAFLADHGIWIRDCGSSGPLAGCIRITVGTPDQNQELLNLLTEVLLRH